jgi:hypothetical protein
MFDPADNRITPSDRGRAYEILGFVGPERRSESPRLSWRLWSALSFEESRNWTDTL